MTLMNPFEQEILKYEKKGFKKDQKKTLKYGSRIFLVNKKGLFGTDEAVYIYYVDKNASNDSMRECFKEYEKFWKTGYNPKGLFLCYGNCDEKLFRDLRTAMIRDSDIRNSIKLISLEEPIKIEVEKIKDAEVKEKSTKRIKLTNKERLYVWEHSEKYGNTCNICGETITKLSDLELDHMKPFSKGGVKMALAHRDCNRMKGSKNLRHVQTKMGFRTPKT